MKCIKIMSAAFLFLSIFSCNKNTVEKPTNEPVIEPVRTEKTTQTVETTNNNETSPKTKAALPTTNVALHKVMTVTENLNLRQSEDKESAVLTVMAAGSKVKILYLGKGETIDGTYSNWVKVEVQPGSKDRDGKPIRIGTKGWCYGGYTENPEEPDNSTYDDVVDEKIDPEFEGNLYFFDLTINDSIDTVKEKLRQHGCEFEDGTDEEIGLTTIWNKDLSLIEKTDLDFMITFHEGELYGFTKWSLSLEEAQNICNFYGRDFDVTELKLNQGYTIKKGNWEVEIGNEGNMNTLRFFNPEAYEIIRKKYEALGREW